MEWVATKTLWTRSSFVVGADGYHSVIRERLGIPLGKVKSAQVFSVFEFDSPAEVGGEIRVVLDDDATSVLWPMKDGRCRWSFEIEDAERHEPTREYLNAHIRERAPWFPEVDDEIHWSSSVMFPTCLAERFGRGRIWLAGDSVHLTSPVGVQSMNAGLAEAHDLGDKIAEILGGNASMELLESYSTEHLDRWRFLLGLAAPLEARNGTEEWIARRATRILSSTPATGQDLRRLLAQIGLRSGVEP
jgi:putative polyketide hydroxylase